MSPQESPQIPKAISDSSFAMATRFQGVEQLHSNVALFFDFPTFEAGTAHRSHSMLSTVGVHV